MITFIASIIKAFWLLLSWMTLAAPLAKLCSKSVTLDAEEFPEKKSALKLFTLLVFSLYGSFFLVWSGHRYKPFVKMANSGVSKILVRMQRKCDWIFSNDPEADRKVREDVRARRIDVSITSILYHGIIKPHPVRFFWFVLFGPWGFIPFFLWFLHEIGTYKTDPKNLKHSMKFVEPGMGDDRKLTRERG